jgi:hypothetical protein
LVYVIAAYTITIGTLALYGVMIRHRQRVATAALVQEAGSLVPDPRKGFNIGAALLAPFWMWVHGMRIPGVVLLVVALGMLPLAQAELWIPLMTLATIVVAAAAALGFAGNRIAVDHLALEDPAAFASSQLPWAVAGIVLHVIVIPWVYFFLIA